VDIHDFGNGRALDFEPDSEPHEVEVKVALHQDLLLRNHVEGPAELGLGVVGGRKWCWNLSSRDKRCQQEFK